MGFEESLDQTRMIFLRNKIVKSKGGKSIKYTFERVVEPKAKKAKVQIDEGTGVINESVNLDLNVPHEIEAKLVADKIDGNVTGGKNNREPNPNIDDGISIADEAVQDSSQQAMPIDKIVDVGSVLQPINSVVENPHQQNEVHDVGSVLQVDDGDNNRGSSALDSNRSALHDISALLDMASGSVNISSGFWHDLSTWLNRSPIVENKMTENATTEHGDIQGATTDDAVFQITANENVTIQNAPNDVIANIQSAVSHDVQMQSDTFGNSQGDHEQKPKTNALLLAQIDDVIVISDDDSPQKCIKSEPVDESILVERLATIEKENAKLKIHCEALQSKLLDQLKEQQCKRSLESWQPSAMSTMNGTDESNSDKENAIE